MCFSVDLLYKNTTFMITYCTAIATSSLVRKESNAPDNFTQGLCIYAPSHAKATCS